MNNADPPDRTDRPVARILLTRLAAMPLLKPFAITAGMTAFFCGYFWLLQHTAASAYVVPTIALDRLIDFQPAALWLYVSLWVYVALVPSLQVTPRGLLAYCLAVAAICALAFAVFFFWPSTTPPADVDLQRHPLFRALRAIDRSGNALPSLHASFAVFSCFWLAHLLRQAGAGRLWFGVNVLWCAGILYSTVATRQHVVVDLLAGALLGLAGFRLQLHLLRLPGLRGAPGSADAKT